MNDDQWQFQRICRSRRSWNTSLTFWTSIYWGETAAINEHFLLSSSASLKWKAALMCCMATISSGHLLLVSNCKTTAIKRDIQQVIPLILSTYHFLYFFKFMNPMQTWIEESQNITEITYETTCVGRYFWIVLGAEKPKETDRLLPSIAGHHGVRLISEGRRTLSASCSFTCPSWGFTFKLLFLKQAHGGKTCERKEVSVTFFSTLDGLTIS